jgi:hypothetical protein
LTAKVKEIAHGLGAASEALRRLSDPAAVVPMTAARERAAELPGPAELLALLAELDREQKRLAEIQAQLAMITE